MSYKKSFHDVSHEINEEPNARVNMTKTCMGGNVVRGNQTVMQMKSLRDHRDMSYGSNKQWNQLCE